MSERPTHGEDGGTGGRESDMSTARLFPCHLRPAFMSLSPTSLVSAGGLASRGERYVKGEGTEPEHSVSQGRRSVWME